MQQQCRSEALWRARRHELHQPTRVTINLQDVVTLHLGSAQKRESNVIGGWIPEIAPVQKLGIVRRPKAGPGHATLRDFIEARFETMHRFNPEAAIPS